MWYRMSTLYNWNFVGSGSTSGVHVLLVAPQVWQPSVPLEFTVAEQTCTVVLVVLYGKLFRSAIASAATDPAVEIEPASGGVGEVGEEKLDAGEEKPWIAYSVAFRADDVRPAATIK